MNYAQMTDYLSVSEAAAMAGYVEEYVRRLCREGKIKAEHKSRVWWIDKESFEEYWLRMQALGPKRHNPHTKKSE